jgi:hypothetical protein
LYEIVFVAASSQNLYNYYTTLREVLLSQLRLDVLDLFGQSDPSIEQKEDFLSTTQLAKSNVQLRTLPLLIELVKLMIECQEQKQTGMSSLSSSSSSSQSQCSPNVFTVSTDINWTLEKQTVATACEAIKNIGLTVKNMPVSVIDEVPNAKTHRDLFFQVLLLRNLFRCLGLLCILSGTESTMINMIGNTIGSRNSEDYLWTTMLLEFPPVDLSSFPTVVEGTYLHKLLLRSRPLFVSYLMKQLADHVNRTITCNDLIGMNNGIRTNKNTLHTMEGLISQSLLLFRIPTKGFVK